jgi:thioredoxin reductase (NADPH)
MNDCIIIGSGPAGLTAGIYASRANLKALVVGGFMWGGQLMLTSDVENFPGFPKGILGPDLMDNLRIQAERFGAEIKFEDVNAVDLTSKPFQVYTGSDEYKARSLIIATGASARWLGLENETRLRGKGVSACATCDAPFFKDKKAVVVGGGDSAMEEALFLSRYANEVKVIHRRNKLKASKVLQRRAFKNPKIKFIWESTVTDILGQNKVEGVKLQRVNKKEIFSLDCDAVFIAIGHIPNTELFKDHIEMDQYGYINTKDMTQTNIEGVFAAGDVVDFRYRQAVTASASGCKAALDAEKYLQGL